MEKERDMTWTTLKSEYLIKRPWLTARKDKVQLPNGNINEEYYVLEYPDWINVIAVTEDDMFVFIRQYRYALGRTCYEIVAGVLNEGEKPEDGARRELQEETGYSGGEWRELMQISANPSTMTNTTHCFVAEGVNKTSGQKLDDTEDIEVYLFSREEVLNLLKSGELKQALMIAPLWQYLYSKIEGK